MASEPASFDVGFGTDIKALGRPIWVGHQETRDVSAIFRVGQKCDLSTLLSIRNLSVIDGNVCGQMGSYRHKFASFYSLEDLRIQVPTLMIYSDVFVVLLLPYVFIDAPSVIPIPLPLGRHLSWPSFYCVSLRVYLVNNSFSFSVSLSVVPPTPITLEVRCVI